MQLALSLAALAAVVIAVAALCRRYDLPAPIILVALGAAGSFLPFVPEVHLTSEVVLVGLLPPLLYGAALQTSLVDFNANRRAILLLSIGLVAFTTVGVAVVAYNVIPGVTWPAAFALGAVVAPPDAVSATAIARRIGIPRRIVTILEGESLLNDATALVAFRTAIAVGATVTALSVGADFLLAAAGGVAVGLLMYLLIGRVRRRVTDPVIDTSLSLVTPFVAYVAAEEIHGSGVLAVVIAGLLLGHKAPVLQTATSRIAERLNWRTIQFLLENTVFLLIGLQARWILRDVADSGVPVSDVVKLCVATFVAVVVLRLVWVFPARYLLVRPEPEAETGRHPSWKYTAVLGWAGMRGVVTLAAAFAIPESFDYRETLILTALVVAAGTLIVQGSTLPLLVRRLGLPAPDPREDALARAALFEKATAAGVEVLDLHSREDDPYNTIEALRGRAAQRNTAAWERLGSTHPDDETPSEAYARLRLEMLQAEREKVLHVRSTGEDPARGHRGRARDAGRRGVDARHPQRPERGAGGRRGGPRGGRHDRRLRPPAVGTPRRRVGRRVRVRGLRARGLHRLGAPAQVPRAAGTWPAATPRRAGTRARTSTRAGHPVMRSAEPGEEWRWCFVDSRLG